MSQRRRVIRRGALLWGLILPLVLCCLTIVGTLALGARNTVDQLSDGMIGAEAERIELQLASFFGPVETALEAGGRWGEAGLLDPTAERAMLELLVPMMEQLPAVSTLLLADSDGHCLSVYREEGGWRTRRTDVAAFGETQHYTRWSDALEAGEQWTEDTGYDARTRPWYQAAVGRQETAWTAPYMFFTAQQPGVTGAVSWRQEEVDLVLGLDVLLSELSAFSGSLATTRGGMAAILAGSGELIGVPRAEVFTSPDAHRAAVLARPDASGLPALADGIAALADKDGDLDSFRSGGAVWLGALRQLRSGPGGQIAVLVPRADLLGAFRRQLREVIAISVSGLLIALGVTVLLERQLSRRVADALANRDLGRYRLVEKIEEGGMGAVWKAQHELLRRPTAIKLLKPEMAHSEDAMKRFEKEVQLTSQLTHPNTIAIYDYGRTPENVFYYAMEFVEGINLQQLVTQSGPMQPERVIHILMQTAGSLAEAHEAGLIHRDIKPSNLMLCTRGGVHDTVKVLDFGLVADAADRSDTWVQRNQRAGTPMYISPEAVGSPETMDARSDLYQLGAVAYFLLSGQTLFNHPRAEQLYIAHQKEAPLPPSHRCAREIPADLERLVMRCLAKHPDQRPESARAFMTELRACHHHALWSAELAERWWNEADASGTVMVPTMVPLSEPVQLPVMLAAQRRS